jgi:hypothetical protein
MTDYIYFYNKKQNMEECQMFNLLPWLVPVIVILAIWASVWKFIALWKSARNNHIAWFICIAIINTIGILPIIYILTHRKKE